MTINVKDISGFRYYVYVSTPAKRKAAAFVDALMGVKS